MDAATCLAEEMSFSSLAWPCTAALAASQRLLVAAATMRACGEIGYQGAYASQSWGRYALTSPKELATKLSCHVSAGRIGSKKHVCFFHQGNVQGGEHPHFCSRKQEKGPSYPQSRTVILTAEMSPWDHCPSSTALAGMAPTCQEARKSEAHCPVQPLPWGTRATRGLGRQWILSQPYTVLFLSLFQLYLSLGH